MKKEGSSLLQSTDAYKPVASPGEGLFCFAFGLSFFWYLFKLSMLASYMPSLAGRLVFVLSGALILLKIVFVDSYTRRELMQAGLVTVIFTLSSLMSKDRILLIILLFILGAKGINFDQIIKTYLWIGIPEVLVIMLLAQYKVITNLIIYRSIDQGGAARQSFGFSSPTDFSAIVLFLFIAYCYLKRGKLKFIDYVVTLFISYFLLVFCDARLDVISLLLVCLAMLLYSSLRFLPRQHWLARLFHWTWLTFPISAFLSVWLTLTYRKGSTFYAFLDNALSGRLHIGRQGYDKYGLSLFGQHIVEHGNGGNIALKTNWQKTAYFYLDSSFIRLLLIYGIILFLFIVIFFSWYSFQLTKQGNLLVPLILAIVAVNSMIEPNLLQINKDPFLYLIFAQLPLTHNFSPFGGGHSGFSHD
ncbi:hypothetical protein [Loigolactobacillus backii]|uniref:hypothetical protein n=1 Tax=Loigolactobacillus backii TaxID=375175 RepID=UPI0022FD8C9D|nr:hypothetical protein [Loigolactobacillus backii]